MVKKIKACIFISGKGSNLQSIIKNSRDYNFPIKIGLIISNNINAKGLKLAKKYSIPYKFISYKNRRIFERKCLFEIKKNKIKFFGYKIINIHPSLLPKYKGLNTHERVLKNKEKYSGCTVHFVTSKLDSGKIISQKKVLIDKNETEQSLKKKILVQEHKLYSQSIISIFK